MSPFELVIYSLDALLAVIVIYISVRITRASTAYMWNSGNGKVQDKMRFIILTHLLIIVALAFIAVLLNLAITFFN